MGNEVHINLKKATIYAIKKEKGKTLAEKTGKKKKGKKGDE